MTFGLVFRSTTSAAPAIGNYDSSDYLGASYAWCTATAYAVDADGATEKGLNVDPTVEARRRMWFMVRMPKATSSQSEFTARVYIQANLPQ